MQQFHRPGTRLRELTSNYLRTPDINLFGCRKTEGARGTDSDEFRIMTRLAAGKRQWSDPGPVSCSLVTETGEEPNESRKRNESKNDAERNIY